MPGVGTGSVLKTVDARECKLFVALLANNTAPTARITPVVLTNSAALTASATATMTLSAAVAPGVPIKAGQFLQFQNAAGSYLAKVRTDYTSGTSLQIVALENIPANATAKFPAEIDLATSHSLPTQTATNSVSTYQHKGQGEVSRGDTTRSIEFSCLKSYYAAGQRTLLEAIENERDLYIEIQDPNPDANTFATPPIRWVTGIPSDGSESGDNGDKLSIDFTLQISGKVNQVDPAV